VRINDVSKGVLSDSTVKALETHLNEHPEIMRVFALPNIKNVADSSTLPRGTLTVVSSDASLNPSLIPSRLLAALTIYKISSESGEPLEDSSFSPEHISAALQEILGEGPSLGDIYVEHCDPQLAGRDKAEWKPSLGKRGFVSISKYEPRRFESTYYICVFNSNDKLSSELVNIADDMSLQTDIHSIEGKNTPTKLASFMARKEYQFAKVLARRNNDRVAMQLAQKLELKVNRMREDVDGLIDISTRKHAVIAVPDTVTYFGHLTKVEFNDGKANHEAIAIFDSSSGVVSNAQGSVIPLSPIEGIALFEGLPASNSIRADKLTNCLPCGVGHTGEHRKLDTALTKYVGTCVHWVGKENQHRLHTKTTQDYRHVDSVLDSLPLEHATYKKLEHVFTTLPPE